MIPSKNKYSVLLTNIGSTLYFKKNFVLEYQLYLPYQKVLEEKVKEIIDSK